MWFSFNALDTYPIIDTYPNLAKLNCRQHVHEEIVCKVLDRISFSFLFLAEWEFSLIRNKGYIYESNLPNERGREELLQHKDKLFVGANFSVVKGSLDLNFSLSKL